MERSIQQIITGLIEQWRSGDLGLTFYSDLLLLAWMLLDSISGPQNVYGATPDSGAQLAELYKEVTGQPIPTRAIDPVVAGGMPALGPFARFVLTALVQRAIEKLADGNLSPTVRAMVKEALEKLFGIL